MWFVLGAKQQDGGTKILRELRGLKPITTTVEGIHPGPSRASNQPLYDFGIWKKLGEKNSFAQHKEGFFVLNLDPLRENVSLQKNDMKIQQIKWAGDWRKIWAQLLIFPQSFVESEGSSNYFKFLLLETQKEVARTTLQIHIGISPVLLSDTQPQDTFIQDIKKLKS